MATATRQKACKITLENGKSVNRVVHDATDFGDGFIEGYITMNGERVRVERKKRSRVWRVVA